MIKLGTRVRDKVTGFEGIAVARVRYLNGCIQYCIQPEWDGATPIREGSYVDESQLIKIEGGLYWKEEEQPKKPEGGGGGGQVLNIPKGMNHPK